MPLSKFSAKNLGEKLKSEKKIAAKKAEDERKKRELVELERQRKEELEWLDQVEKEEARKHAERQRQIYLDGLMVDCLDAALNNIQGVRLDPDDFESYEDYFEAKGFYFEEQDIESELIQELEEKLNRLDSKDLSNLQLKLLKILTNLDSINWQPAKPSIGKLLQEKNVFLFSKKTLLFLSQGLSYHDENQGNLFEDDIDHPKLMKFVLSIEKDEALIRDYIPYPLDEDEELWLLKWDSPEKDEINDNWFTATNLNWISSKPGQIFFDAFLKLINLKIEALSDSLSFDAFEKNGQAILVFEDNSKLKAGISLPHLLELFDVFGYKKKILKTDASEKLKNITISWST